MIRAGDPKPQPGTARYNIHRRRIYIIVVSAYLLYTIYEADHDLRRAGDFYQDLAVPHAATDREIKSRFRRMATIHHPDKVGNNGAGDDYFVHLKMAQDTLLNPAKRFAYERFGPEVVNWQRCSSVRDYLTNGIQALLPYYIGTAILMYVLGFVGYFEWGTYWRWITLIILCVFELHTISRPSFPFLVDKFLNPFLTSFTKHPPYLPFQLISMARKVCVTMHIAFSQIGPMISPPEPSAVPANLTPEAHLHEQLNRLGVAANSLDIEVGRLMGMEMSPFVGDPQAVSSVKSKVKEWLVQNTIRNDPEVRDAMGNLFKKRRADAPAGARGNR